MLKEDSGFDQVEVLWVKKLEEIYSFDKKIGSGQYGKVWTAVDVITKRLVVCKIVDRKADYVRELDHLISLRNCYGVLPIKKAVFSTLNLCMEFDLGETSLYNYIRKRPSGSLKDTLCDSMRVAYQLLQSLAEIHANGIVHRDLKSSNIVMLNKKAWIIDFGMSKRLVDPNGQDVSFYEIVTSTYRAPELWRPVKSRKNSDSDSDASDDEDNQPRKYDKTADVWSLGCILFELLTKESPFTGQRESDVRKRIAGHVLHSGSKVSDSVWIDKVVPVDLEREIQDFCYPDRKKSRHMDLCSSLEDMMISPSPPRKKAVKMSEEEDEECHRLLYVIKRVLRGALDPNPKKRYTAEQCLMEMNKNYKPKTYAVKSPQIGQINHSLDPNLCVQVLKVMFGACDFHSINPRVVYLSIYNWIRVVGTSKEMCNDFSLITIMLGCMRLAASYCGEDVKCVRNMRRHITKSVERSPKKEVNCCSGILSLLKGRMWIKNPGDFRELLGCELGVWDIKVDQAIFTFIITSLGRQFSLPDPQEIVAQVAEYLQLK